MMRSTLGKNMLLGRDLRVKPEEKITVMGEQFWLPAMIIRKTHIANVCMLKLLRIHKTPEHS